MSSTDLRVPRLARGVRLRRDEVRGRTVLLFPEGAVTLNETAVAVLELCDGERTLDAVVRELSSRYDGADVRTDVEELIGSLAARGLVVDGDA
jgi:pyrroloquinoline quinone biosynthesis protein D